jgi:hypothetical protein
MAQNNYPASPALPTARNSPPPEGDLTRQQTAGALTGRGAPAPLRVTSADLAGQLRLGTGTAPSQNYSMVPSCGGRTQQTDSPLTARPNTSSPVPPTTPAGHNPAARRNAGAEPPSSASLQRLERLFIEQLYDVPMAPCISPRPHPPPAGMVGSEKPTRSRPGSHRNSPQGHPTSSRGLQTSHVANNGNGNGPPASAAASVGRSNEDKTQNISTKSQRNFPVGILPGSESRMIKISVNTQLSVAYKKPRLAKSNTSDFGNVLAENYNEWVTTKYPQNAHLMQGSLLQSVDQRNDLFWCLAALPGFRDHGLGMQPLILSAASINLIFEQN